MLRLALAASLLTGVLLTPLLSGCTSPRAVAGPDGPPAPGDTTRAALDAARARWEAAGLDDYRFVYQVTCFCPEEARGPFALTVRDGVVVEALFQGRAMDPADPRFATVDALFETLAEAFDRGAASVRVTYDAALGYPAEAYVDYETMVADEELGFAVRDLTPLGG
ncbi:MAG TPA: DUF6174 domain-containing protein [Rubricoccaceae bacterium]|jgi:hypothetical protein|nr:DUF6174 domain-containing protein [Rubricoccaceae bacterium]